VKNTTFKYGGRLYYSKYDKQDQQESNGNKVGWCDFLLLELFVFLFLKQGFWNKINNITAI
jgi:hypothetical protein